MWSCPRDATWINPGENVRCVSPADIIMLLKSSDFIVHDLCHPFDCCIDSKSSGEGAGSGYLTQDGQLEPGQSPPGGGGTDESGGGENSWRRPGRVVLALRRWFDGLRNSMEFRCFVRNGTLVGISQRHCSQAFEFLLDSKRQIIDTLASFHDQTVRGAFRLDCRARVSARTCVCVSARACVCVNACHTHSPTHTSLLLSHTRTYRSIQLGQLCDGLLHQVALCVCVFVLSVFICVCVRLRPSLSHPSLCFSVHLFMDMHVCIRARDWRVFIVDFNVFGGLTQPLLFSWADLLALDPAADEDELLKDGAAVLDPVDGHGRGTPAQEAGPAMLEARDMLRCESRDDRVDQEDRIQSALNAERLPHPLGLSDGGEGEGGNEGGEAVCEDGLVRGHGVTRGVELRLVTKGNLLPNLSMYSRLPADLLDLTNASAIDDTVRALS